MGQTLRSLRGETSRVDVAKNVGVSYHSIVAYESGRRVPGDAITVKLAEYFKVSVEDIFYN